MAGATEHSPNMDPAMAGATEHVAVDATEHTVSRMTFNSLVADFALLVPLLRSPCIVTKPLACGA